MSSINPATRKQTLSFAAVLFLMVAAFYDPRILHNLACHVGIITVAFMVVCAFAAAHGIRKLADVFFRGSVSPWYARPGVVVYLCIILPVANVLFIIIDNLFFSIPEIGQVTSQQIRIWIFMGLELWWITLLE